MVKVVTNSDKSIVNEIRNKLKANDGYCPCSLIKNQDTKCMCKEFRDMIEQGELGECHCGLYTILDNSQ